MVEGLRKEEDLIVLIVTLHSYGCPRQAIVHAYGLDERTVARWQERAGQHCQKVHKARVMQAKLNLEHVQADENRVKGHRMIGVDGHGDHGLHEIVAGRRRERASGPQASRPPLGDGESVRWAAVRAADRDGWVGLLPQQSSPGLSRKGEAPGPTRTLPRGRHGQRSCLAPSSRKPPKSAWSK